MIEFRFYFKEFLPLVNFASCLHEFDWQIFELPIDKGDSFLLRFFVSFTRQKTGLIPNRFIRSVKQDWISKNHAPVFVLRQKIQKNREENVKTDRSVCPQKSGQAFCLQFESFKAESGKLRRL
ncbi:hypothetical protein [Allobaculum sp. Allo2]|uniref:hypothetical protein n=1 Tax=Allobaculum sp. Allo2 TaxID=2853432 RepID=UPI001F603943|nr:hypothetical protein [Allobaculum sp. Allo2]UNT92404.1 hypothetical protein KWG61_09470 [Allobaculum sp. Allo2]